MQLERALVVVACGSYPCKSNNQTTIKRNQLRAECTPDPRPAEYRMFVIDSWERSVSVQKSGQTRPGYQLNQEMASRAHARRPPASPQVWGRPTTTTIPGEVVRNAEGSDCSQRGRAGDVRPLTVRHRDRTKPELGPSWRRVVI